MQTGRRTSSSLDEKHMDALAATVVGDEIVDLRGGGLQEVVDEAHGAEADHHEEHEEARQGSLFYTS